MRRQRSKAELLKSIQTYQALKKDEELGNEISRKTVYWRSAVIWSVALWQNEKFSANEIADFLQYIVSNGVTDLPDERREEIRKMLGDKVDWSFRNTVTVPNKGNLIDQSVRELEYYNTKVYVDYSLLACEYLMKHKGYARKRLNRVVGNVMFLDRLDASTVWDMRQDLFDRKGIWIDLDGDEPPADARVVQ